MRRVGAEEGWRGQEPGLKEKPAQVRTARTKARRTQDSSTGDFERWCNTAVQTVGLAHCSLTVGLVTYRPAPRLFPSS